jgi:hypothetical protein
VPDTSAYYNLELDRGAVCGFALGGSKVAAAAL